MTTFSTTALQAEINTDPKALYTGVKTDRAAILAKINATYAGVGVVFRNDVRAAEVLAALVWSEIAALSTNNWLALHALLLPLVIDATQARVRAIFTGLFPSATFPTTSADLTTVAQKANPSRAEELWGYQVTVSEQQLADAGF